MREIRDADLRGKRVILRADLNVPMDEIGNILDATRIYRLVPTIEFLKSQGARIILISHLGRPNGYDKSLSLAQLLPALREAYNAEIDFLEDYSGAAARSELLGNGDILLLENLRFHVQEEANDIDWARSLSEIGDLYVNDAFACSHRSHASIVGITKFLPSYPGLLLQEEIMNLERGVSFARHPSVAIIGGKKVSTKYKVLESLSEYIDCLVLTGGMANTFLAALGYNLGDSFVESEVLKSVSEFIKIVGREKILLPSDFTVLSNGCVKVVDLSDIKEGDVICDIGSESLCEVYKVINDAKTLIWNGPVGIYEDPRFSIGSDILARFIAKRSSKGELYSVVGGGDLLAVLAKGAISESFSYVSTGGGAFLEWLANPNLPGITALMHNE